MKTSASATRWSPYGKALARSAAALLGGYGASFALTFCLARLLLALGLERVDAAAFPAMLSFIVWLLLALHAFAAPGALRAWWPPLAIGSAALAIAALLPGSDA